MIQSREVVGDDTEVPFNCDSDTRHVQVDLALMWRHVGATAREWKPQSRGFGVSKISIDNEWNVVVLERKLL